MNPFKILGIEQNSNEAEIKKAYKKLAMENHPDRNPNNKEAEEKLKEINGAYELLKRNNWKYQENPFSHFNSNGDGFGFNFNDIFNSFFSHLDRDPFTGRPKSRKTAKLYITLEEAYNGCEKNINISEEVNCSCSKGFILDSKVCSSCNGTGQRRVSRGVVNMVSTCSSCRGFGRPIKSVCPECNGKGSKTINEEIKITVPSGVNEGYIISHKNINIELYYAPHKEYKFINHFDTTSKKEIDVFTALLGGTIVVNTLEGEKSVKIPENCEPNTMLRIKQSGMKIGDKKGNHYLEIKVKFPKNLTKKQKNKLRKIKDELEGKNE